MIIVYGVHFKSIKKCILLIFLFIAVSYIVDVPDKITQIMSLPQLFTALSGGVIAILAYKALWVIGIDRTKEIPKDIK